MEQAGIATVASILQGEIHAPSAEIIVATWLLSLGLNLLMYMLPRKLRRVGLPSWGRSLPPGAAVLQRTVPSVVYTRLAPGVSVNPTRRDQYIDRLEEPGKNVESMAFILLDAAHEELLFRGLPLWIAIAVWGNPVLAVAVGTVIWAVPHGSAVLPGTLVSGTLYAWLWLTGGWWLAIAIHGGTNMMVSLLAQLNRWVKDRRRDTDASRDGVRSDRRRAPDEETA